MALDSMTDASYYQFEKYLNSNPYREYVMNKPYIPKTSSISSRLKPQQQNNKSTFITFHPLVINQRDSSTLDRNIYKLRMKSSLSMGTLRDSHTPHNLPRRYYSNRPNAIIMTPSTTPKPFTRQPTAITRTTTSIKTTVTGIEGNAVRVTTLNDLINQFHYPTESSDNVSTSISIKPVINGHLTSKPSERILKQAQALTEYRFNVPPTSSSIQRRKDHNDSPLLIEAYHPGLNSFERQAIMTSSHSKRIQESREKISSRTEKQICICNKLTIIDPFNSEQNRLISPLTKRPSAKYIFPPVRPIGYFTKKTTDELLRSASNKKTDTKTKRPDSTDSYDQISIEDEDSLQFFNHTNKSRQSLTDVEDDLHNPPNTTVNMDLKNDK